MPRQIIDLNGHEWRLGQLPDNANPASPQWDELRQIVNWLPAQVPGNIQADLVDAGYLPDPNSDFDAKALRVVGEQSWWLVREFRELWGAEDHIRIVLRGIDYLGDVFLNSHHLGRHEGMFAPQEYDVTGLLRTENRLAVRLLGSRWLPRDRSSGWEKLLNRAEARFSGLPGSYPDRRDTLKCQMQFGWDFAPPLLTMGLWDDVYLALSGQVFVRLAGATFKPAQAGADAGLDMRVALACKRRCALRLVFRLEGETFAQEPQEGEKHLALDRGSAQIRMRLPLPQPHLWWPWDHGEPSLYRLTVEVWDDKQLLDRDCRLIGLRQIEFDNYQLRVNGRPVFARGANWVPASLFPGRVTEQDYADLLSLARSANMNMLRVWGGGLREKQTFYDTCDRLGILVWQEFPLACAFLTRFPRSKEYLELVRQESSGIVRDLGHHACIALWSGGNEFSVRRNRPVIETLREVIRAEDPARVFLPASPFMGDHHNWLVWHAFLAPSAYLQDDARFASEFGLQSTPDADCLRRFLPPGQTWPPGEAWTLHGAGLQKLWRYARPFLPAPARDHTRPAWAMLEPESFVHASQEAQLQGLKIAIEHFRRRKAAGCGGVLIWQLNEPWPAISWAVIPYSRGPKPAWRAVRSLFAPLAVSLVFPLRHYLAGDCFSAEAWIVNETAESLLDCELRVALCDTDGHKRKEMSQVVDVAASSVAVAARVRWALLPADGWVATCSLLRGDTVLAASQYDLALWDAIRPTPAQRLWSWLAGLLTRL